MKWCANCGKEMADDAMFCPGCGASAASQQPVPQRKSEPDVPDTLMNVLAFFFPLVGLIIFLLERDTSPIKANSCGKWALIGFLVSTGLSILGGVGSFLLSLLPFLFY